MTKSTQKTVNDDVQVAQTETEREYEDSPNAPFNRHSIRPLGPSTSQQPKTDEERIEKEKEYFHGGTKP
ncbi:hypothetical protein [Anatilimnocola floriformis]|uniref:hypothetical protein n=1 Tax=Anatilimnocola floriformis TaxID=2948575 RepID=UPI0020C405DA|nr:hypothetical protein [Anatilimnocola floriformis]